jgi:hypothetical protein
MAIFGAPIERENDADRAIHAALDMRRALIEMNKTMEPDRILGNTFCNRLNTFEITLH